MASSQSNSTIGRLIGIALVAVALFVAGFVVRPVLVSSPSIDTQVGSELDPIRADIQALSDRIADLQSAIEAQRQTLAEFRSSESQNLAQLTEQVNSLSSQLDKLQSSVADVRDRFEAQTEAQGNGSDGRSDGRPQPDPASVGPDDDPYLGAEDAPVTIIEFSDFQCPYCQQFEQQTFPRLKSEYVDTGQVRFVYRDFPLTRIHPNALPAAIAAECADNQGSFWPMHDRLFANQNAWGPSDDPNAVFLEYAEEMGLEMESFRECVQNRETLQEISGDFQDGVDGGVRGTPAFFIGGEMLSGAQPFSAFQQRIEALLREDAP